MSSRDLAGTELSGGFPSVGSYIRAVRLRAGLTGQQLADQIKHSLTWLYRLEVGDRAVPGASALEAISDACGLSDWECCYLFALAGLPPPRSGVVDATLLQYAEQSREPMGWLEDELRFYYNPEARRLFKGIGEYPGLGDWLWQSPQAQRILLNWDDVAEWFTSAVKLYFITSLRGQIPDARVGEALIELPDFRRRWQASSIPLDPASFRCEIYDIDNNLDRTVDMRFWAHPYRQGLIAIGNTLRSAPHK